MEGGLFDITSPEMTFLNCYICIRFSPWEQLGIEGGLFDITSPGMTFPNCLYVLGSAPGSN